MPPLPLDDATRLRLEAADLTYGDDVRADAAAPAGYRRLELSRRIGSGGEVFDAACDSLFSWRMHERAGFHVMTSRPVIEVGLVLTLTTRVGPMDVVAPCRVVRVDRGPDRCGFTYGTLPGHPVSGEEEFVLHKRPDGDVVATIAAVSRPDSLLARLGTPVTRRQQERIAARYLASFEGES